MIPSAADAPTLTLAACTLMASEFPKAFTPDQRHALGTLAVDAVMAVWDEFQTRIGAQAQAQAQLASSTQPTQGGP